MSALFEITRGTIGDAELDALLSSAKQELNADFLRDPAFTADEEGPVAHLVADGSSRGVVIRRYPDKLSVRLSALASGLDWRMAYGFMRGVQRQQGGAARHENGSNLKLEDLSDGHARRDGAADFLDTMRAFRKSIEESDGGQCALPLGDFNLRLRLKDFPDTLDAAGAERLEKFLADGVRRYSRALRASVTSLDSGLSTAVWNFGSTRLPHVDLIECPASPNPIAWMAIQRVFRREIELVGENPPLYFVPSFDAAAPQNAERLAEMASFAVQDLEMFSQQQMIYYSARLVLNMMKNGATPEACVAQFVQRGLQEEDARMLTTLTVQTTTIYVQCIQDHQDMNALALALHAKGIAADAARPVIEALTDAQDEL